MTTEAQAKRLSQAERIAQLQKEREKLVEKAIKRIIRIHREALQDLAKY